MFHIPAHYAAAALHQPEMPRTSLGHMLCSECVYFWSVCVCVYLCICVQGRKLRFVLYVSVLLCLYPYLPYYDIAQLYSDAYAHNTVNTE